MLFFFTLLFRANSDPKQNDVFLSFLLPMVLLLGVGLSSWWRLRWWSPGFREVHEGEGPQEFRRQDGSRPQIDGFQVCLVGWALEEVLRGVFLVSTAGAQRSVG